jgi:predicted HTH domain antitoxin
MWQADEVSLERAAEIAGMNFFLFRDLMIQRGITVVVDTTEEEARAQAQEIHDRFM